MTLAQGRAPKEPAEGKASRLDDAVGPQTEAVVDLTRSRTTCVFCVNLPGMQR